MIKSAPSVDLDFYLPKLGMYIEVCGTENISYEYRKDIYRKNGYHVIFVQICKRKMEKLSNEAHNGNRGSKTYPSNENV